MHLGADIVDDERLPRVGCRAASCRRSPRPAVAGGRLPRRHPPGVRHSRGAPTGPIPKASGRGKPSSRDSRRTASSTAVAPTGAP